MRNLVAITAVALAFLPLAVPAHGPEKHGKPAAPKPISAEEHPWGRQGDPKKATRTIAIGMSDAMRFTPAEVSVKQGETVRFVVKNDGKAMHEMVIGTLAELKAHGELMKKHPNMEHDEPYMAHVEPGKSAEIVWTFTKAGEFHYGCLVPGHFDAGMIGRIVVAAQGAAVAQADAASLADAEVRRVDKDAGKITLKHGYIKSLDMPPMTMVFQVGDKALLDKVKPGDKVKFAAVEKAGAYVVTSIDVAK